MALKNMSLKRALFTLAALNILAASILSLIVVFGCIRLNASLADPEVRIMIDQNGLTRIEYPPSETSAVCAQNIISVMQIILPISFFIAALLLTASLFYRLKLKKPLELLTGSAGRMMDNDLDFAIEAPSDDELGRLCGAFETMRASLLETNRELWRQTEERKRLNAAFAHDLRNPLTVIKGSVKLAKETIDDPKALSENLERIGSYTKRLERYVDVMSSVQRLEEIEPVLREVSIDELYELRCIPDPKGLCRFEFPDTGAKIKLDPGIFLRTAENLISNAQRFAKTRVDVRVTVEADRLELTVSDDGEGFPEKLLREGIKPFYGSKDSEHFGMGLYICSALCKRHGGELILENKNGAVARAIFKIVRDS